MITVKTHQFNELITDVQNCTKCARMCDSARVLSIHSGSVNSRLMFIAEAPGRLGADLTMIPLHGDQTGDDFEELLKLAGITRKDFFVTNAVLCNPKTENGNNATPTSGEQQNCLPFLQRQIELLESPAIIVTLGAAALESLEMIQSHNLRQSKDVRTMHSWGRNFLIPLYHPGQQARIRRSFAEQVLDFKFVAAKWVELTQKSAE